MKICCRCLVDIFRKKTKVRPASPRRVQFDPPVVIQRSTSCGPRTRKRLSTANKTILSIRAIDSVFNASELRELYVEDKKLNSDVVSSIHPIGDPSRLSEEEHVSSTHRKKVNSMDSFIGPMITERTIFNNSHVDANN